jgi:hypothetical protein
MAYGTRSTSSTLMLAACIGPSADPLAYGFFCATYDFLMATYFYTRRAAWSADSGSAAIA